VVSDANTRIFQSSDRSEANRYFHHITDNKISLQTGTQQQFIAV